MKLTAATSSLLYLGGTYNDVASVDQASMEQYNILNFLGGKSPYQQYTGFGISTDIPETCTLEQVQLLSRHGERFISADKAEETLEILDKLKAQDLQGPLAFIKDYEWFVANDSLYGEEVTLQNSNSIFSGSLSAQRQGRAFREKYGDLYDSSKTLPVFTTNAQRVYDTSVNFLKGFFNSATEIDSAKRDLGFTTEGDVKINILDEADDNTVNNLTPINSCSNYNEDDFDTPDELKTYATGFISRMKAAGNPNLKLKKGEVKRLIEICAYELNVKGSSQFCSLFTNEEFIRYEYYKDVKQYYTEGPGNKYAVAIGSVLLEASVKLLQEDNDNKLWLSFTHNADIVNYLAAIGLFTEAEDFSLTDVQFGKKFQRAKIVPQSARLALEKYNCDGTSYVRFILNDAVIPMDCSYGPGFSCSLQDYLKLTKSNAALSFNKVCGTKFSNDEITFFWDYDTTSYNATLATEPASGTD